MMSAGLAISSRRIGLIYLVVFTSVILLSCPLPIDQDLLLIVEDDYVPEITITSPLSNSLYTKNIQIDGFVRDFSGQDGDREGALNTLSFSVAGASLLQLDVTFDSDGTPDVDSDYTTFAYDASDGSFVISLSTVVPSILTGAQFLTITVEDRNNNTAEKTITLFEDSSGPFITLASPKNMTNYDVTNPITGSVMNSPTDAAIDDVQRIGWYIPGTDKAGGYSLETGSGDDGFTVDVSTGDFAHSFDTVGLKGSIGFVFEAYDYHNHKSEIAIQLLDNRPGPEIQIIDPQPPPVYSSSLPTTITVTGLVDKRDLDIIDLKPQYVARGGISGQTGGEISPNMSWVNPLFPFFPDPVWAWFQFSFNPSTPTPSISGDITIEITAFDTAGRDSKVTIEIQDESPPSLTVNDKTTTDTTPTITGTVSDPPNAPSTISMHIEITPSGGGSAVYTSDFTPSGESWSHNVSTSLAQGKYDVAVTASDSLGSQASDTGALTVDATAPSVTVDDDTTTDTTPAITGSVSDNVANVSELDMHIEITPDGSGSAVYTSDFTPSGGSWSHTVSTALSEGKYEVTVTAADPALNQASDTGALTVDATAPSVTVSNKTTTDTTPAITGSVSDNVADLSEINIHIEITPSGGSDPDYENDFTPSSGNWSHTVSSPGLSAGDYDISVDATDPAGNTGSDTGSLTIN